MKTYNMANQTRLLTGPEPGTIIFAEEYLLSQDGVQAVNVGFEAIEDMQEVLQLLRQIQEGLE
jgi:predicted aldo/keto reductase-like oxidoreductase